MKTPAPLSSEPPDPAVDSGPKHRGGPFALFIALFCAFSSAGTVLLLWREDFRIWATAGAVVFGGAAMWAAWCVADRFRFHGALPRSHNVLKGALAFEITTTCRDVAATAFLLPDSVRPGDAMQLWCFMENYASRRRVANLRIGAHAGLGLPEPHCVALELAVGQASVYLLSLDVAPGLAPGEHDLPITLKVTKPNGTGARLPGSRRHLYDLWTIHFAAPFTVESTPSNVAVASTPGAHRQRYVLLASVSEPEPRLAVLAQLNGG